MKFPVSHKTLSLLRENREWETDLVRIGNVYGFSHRHSTPHPTLPVLRSYPFFPNSVCSKSLKVTVKIRI